MNITLQTAFVQILTAFIGAFGFSLVFGVRKRYIWLISLDAALSWSVYLLCMLFTNDFFSNLAAALFCATYAAILARLIKVPTTVLLMPATVPMIPGGSLYYTIHYLFIGEYATSISYGFSTIRAIFALATGFALTAILFGKLNR